MWGAWVVEGGNTVRTEEECCLLVAGSSSPALPLWSIGPFTLQFTASLSPSVNDWFLGIDARVT